MALASAEGRAKSQDRKLRTRGLIVLGGYVLKAHPALLTEAAGNEPRKDKRRALHYLQTDLKETA